LHHRVEELAIFSAGCLEQEGMEKLRKGKAPTITKGPYAGSLTHGPIFEVLLRYLLLIGIT